MSAKIVSLCAYCQGCFVYSNDEASEDRDSLGDYEVGYGVYDEAIKIFQSSDGLYYLGYSDGADESGDHNFRAIGCPINFCPNCGRRLDG